MIDTTAAHPDVVSREEWEARRSDVLAAEKAQTKALDRLNARRRRLPMTPMDNYRFDGANGPVTLLDLFNGRPQLIVQNFMFDPDWDAGCPSCSNLADSAPHLSHFGPYDVAIARISRAPIDKITAYNARMGWDAPWVSSLNSTYNQDWGWTADDGEVPGVSCYLQLDGQPYLTYSTSGRGVEPLSSQVGYLDSTVYGRQESWEDSPAGWPQTNPYQKTRRHDEY